MKVLENPSQSLWQKIVRNSPGATYFHTPEWIEFILTNYPHLKNATCGFILKDGAKAILPLVVSYERNRFFGWYDSTGLGVYGGVIGEREIHQDEAYQIYRRIINPRMAGIRIGGNPFRHQVAPHHFDKKPHYTHFLKLQDGYDLVSNHFARDKKKAIRKAQKHGVQIGIAACEEDFLQYFYVYEDTLRRWGNKTLVEYPFTLFQNLARLRSDSIKFWVARIDGNIVAGNIVFYHNQYVFDWHSASLGEFLRYYPDSYLVSEIIRHACDSGYQILDFGASGGLAGVEFYKERFGAEKLSYHSFDWRNNKLHSFYRRLKGLTGQLE
jgi:lipid II:glycine glycyltransferase (peptidoglycan interpeptide bridge formation enzyme)